MKYAERFGPDGVPLPVYLTRLAKRYRTPEGQLRSWFIGGCGIDGCERKALVVDHDHACCLRTPTCGQCTRGVLCTHHNSALESFVGSPAVMRYLHRTRAGQLTLTRSGFTVNDEPKQKRDVVYSMDPNMDRRMKAARQRERKRREARRRFNPSRRRTA